MSSHPYDNLIICGDFNVDFSRGGHNCSSLVSFMYDFNLVRTDVNPNINYTYRRDDHTSFSWPHHILTLSQYRNLIDNIACSESVDNFSDHLPLSFSIAIAHPLKLSSTLNLSCTTNPKTGLDDSHSINTCKVDWRRVMTLIEIIIVIIYGNTIRYCQTPLCHAVTLASVSIILILI